MIDFEAILLKNKDWILIRLPLDISKALPSRGMVMIEGTLNRVDFLSPLEPDGEGSHWFRVTDTLCHDLNLKAGDQVKLSIQASDNWTEPETPKDILDGLHSHDLEDQWQRLTTKARWEWIRWIRSTHNPGTRQKRVEVACSKLSAGSRRPCCFDHSRCTETYVSSKGILNDPFSNKA